MKKLLCQYGSIVRLSATSAFDSRIVYVLSGYLLKFIRLMVLLLVWRSLFSGGAKPDTLVLRQVLTYTFLASLLEEQLNIVTPATMAFWEGALASRYLRPLPVLGQLTAETVGRWLPTLTLYSLPTALAAPLLGIRLLPATPVQGFGALISFILALSLGFALDYLFAALVIYLKNVNWTAYLIRQAIMAVFSGALIPFSLFPWGIGAVLKLLPFGSVAGAPLAIYTGSEPPGILLAVQLGWNLLVWALALMAFHKGQERLVAYGG